MTKLLFIGGLGTGELLVIALVLLLLFGGSKLPELMRGAGKGISEFRDAMNGKESTPTEELKVETPKKE
ncbi:MAG: twin-arginine translocase TatA/TatE family subunit [Rikenellaceae bacterium]